MVCHLLFYERKETEKMIEVRGLTKKYGPHTAIEDLNFTIEKGNVYGFLGPNGAGKSTTMNIMTGCLALTEGTVTIDGFDIVKNPVEAKRRIGYLPEIPPVYLDMTVEEYLLFVAKVKGVVKEELQAQVDSALERTKTAGVRTRLIKHLSKGYRQRVGIAQAIIGNPEIIILDEPTVGLDPKQIIEIRELIRELGKSHTVILSSHILSEIKSVANRMLIISRGKIVENDTAENIEKKYGSNLEEVFLKLTEQTYEIEALEREAENVDASGKEGL